MASGTDAAQRGVEIDVVDSNEALASLRDEWDALLTKAEGVSVFVSWEWNHHWWRHYGKGHQLRVLTARQDGRLTGILPLYIQQTAVYRACPVRLLRLVGTGGDTSPDYLGPLLEPVGAGPTAAALARYLLDELPGWDVLQLSDLTAESAFWSELNAQCGARGLPRSAGISANIAYMALPASWEDYLASVHRDRRYTIRNTRRKFETQHKGRFYVHADEAGIDQPLDSLIRLHHRRWQAAKVEKHAFSSPEYVGFHRDVIHACARRGWIRFYCIDAGDVPVAVFYCYRFRGQIYYFQAGFNPDFERLRPGLVLIGYAVEHAIREGNQVFDFLRGDHEYKNQWGKSTRDTHTLTAYRPGLRAFVYRVREERVPAAKRLVKRLLPFLRRRQPAAHSPSAGRPDV